MFATNKFFVGARHPQSFGISNYLTGAVPLPVHLSRSFFKMVLDVHQLIVIAEKLIVKTPVKVP
ncbi:hypothetical protein NIES37_45620 [Tolypothrix tenuis PCC 7101]|uniref:Uncharacterized protein n=1 Tax=Tolypothrix tenuis PCC 7101 TaxID=231146 RepID=A0A1Z4N4D9_9CYAN|nr:hypothetical protein NIES37_45620 [Tolypothrix tenuis PCC 7101]BAZ75512.1 hypothetical protein NIES50_40950 [Aulosira laxa NIES-50]